MSADAFTDDALLDGRVKLRQPRDGYRVAIDPVLLAAAVPAQPGQRVLDVGCGSGAAMFCLAARVPGVDVTGLEIQPTLAKYAEDGIGLNRLSARARVVVGDLLGLPDMVCAAPFDIVMTNPPFGADGTVSPKESVATAHHEGEADLAAWIEACLRPLKPHGRLVLVHRAERLSQIMAALVAKCGDIRVLPIHPKADQPARRVIVNAGKGRKTADTLLPSLVLHTSDGAYTPAAEQVLRLGQAVENG
jgi:tRNA1(Val) A37 N6-methylase TrmN6